MSANINVLQNQARHCFNSVHNRLYSVQEKIFGFCNTDTKIYAFLITGRILQAAALVSFAVSVAFVFTVGPISLLATIGSIAMGILGTCIAGNPQEVNQFLKISRPFVQGQPIGLTNSGSNCWLNSGLQLLMNFPSFYPRMRQIPELSQLVDAYQASRNDSQKTVKNIDTHVIRQFLNRETAGIISGDHYQEDGAQLFEYLFQGINSLYLLDQRINGAPPSIRREPMIQVDLGASPRPSFQELFNNYFDYRTDIGQHIQLAFSEAPNDLLLHAKRFYQYIDPNSGMLQLGKMNDPIQVSENLVIPPQFIHNGESPRYFCDGFTIHYGATKEAGHYGSYIKKDGIWWYCSDTNVEEVSASQALEAMKDGYIFHFSKIQ